MLLKQEQTEGTENRLKLREERLRLNGRRLDRCLAISFSIIRCDLGDLCDRSVRSEPLFHPSNFSHNGHKGHNGHNEISGGGSSSSWPLMIRLIPSISVILVTFRLNAFETGANRGNGESLKV